MSAAGSSRPGGPQVSVTPTGLLVGTGHPVAAVLVHHAGASSLSMLPPARRLASAGAVFLPDLPGRGTRQTEPPARDLAEAVDVLDAALDPHLGPDTVVVGHSLGGLLVHEVAVRRATAGRPLARVLLSAATPRRSPLLDLPPGDRAAALTLLRRIGGTPAEVLVHPELAAAAADTLAADLALLRDHPGPTPLPTGCRTSYAAWFGREDPLAPPSAGGLWGPLTGIRARDVGVFEGGHFFLLENEAAVEGLAGLVPTAPAAGPAQHRTDHPGGGTWTPARSS